MFRATALCGYLLIMENIGNEKCTKQDAGLGNNMV
jgi:hypothetical protein